MHWALTTHHYPLPACFCPSLLYHNCCRLQIRKFTTDQYTASGLQMHPGMTPTEVIDSLLFYYLLFFYFLFF